MDLRFASPVERLKFTCATCPSAVRRGRKCDDAGYENLKKALDVGNGSLSYKFCPGKATWSHEAAELFEVCRTAMETGIMPKGPNLDDQDEAFAAVLPVFIERWRERNYHRVWHDVREFTESVLVSIFGKK